MPLPPDLPIVDHHCHLSPNGEGVEAARRFAHAGGTHLFLATQQYGPNVPLSIDAYRTQFETTEQLANRIRAEVGAIPYLVVAPYPVDLIRASAEVGLETARAVQEGALDLAGRWVEDQRAVAIGEVGRPHFPVEPPIVEAAEQVFRHALEVARDVGCPAVVHSEDLTPEGYRALAEFAGRVSFPPHQLVKHYARVVTPAAARLGIAPSYVARRELVDAALREPGPWFLETDFLDDPRRPGAVLDLATVPRRAQTLLSNDPTLADRLRVPFSDSIESVYGFRPVPIENARP